VKIMRNITILFFIGLSILLASIASASDKKDKHQHTFNLKILSYNVRNCRGLDNRTDFQRTADVINRIGADCVALQELDSATLRLNNAVALNELASRTKMFPTYNGSINYQGGKYGIGILTREKPIKTEAISLPGKEEQRSLLIVEMKGYIICCTHLSLTAEDRITSVRMIAEKLNKYNKPLFLAGDLNAVPNSTEMNNLLNDFIVITDSTKPTIPADRPNKCIDYILTKKSTSQKVKVIASEVVNEPTASDHRPLWVKVTVKGK
jgi:endonuclease/exonuclease/phosphatase family metal-dependent hydrolase